MGMRKGTRTTLWIAAGTVAVLVAGVGTLAVLNRPLSRAEVDEAIQRRLQDVVAEHESVSSALFATYSGRTGRLHRYAAGTVSAGSDEPVHVDSRFHSASVGKTMLAAVYGQLVDEGRVTFDDPVSRWLDAPVLDGLFVAGRSPDVTLGRLLSHTSGAADYFEGPVVSGSPMIELITSTPDRLFTPADLLAFSRDHQKPTAAPGTAFACSDTGYVLLGLALEAIEGRSYADILERRVFEPLGMHDSDLLTEYGADADILAVTARGVDLSTGNAMSVDWAGGGVVTTTADLVTFMRAFTSAGLVSSDTLARLTAFEHEFEPGIRYGMGVMRFRFSELSPLLFTMSDAYGGVGATGTYALYDPAGDTFFVANYGSLEFGEKAIEELVDLRLIIDRLAD
ncbi:serine hydrolase domain-containing protein [Streptosporangium longisporum]|uniref:Beta-lactamase-related domain-containing protein n=2 Tax=Streptosporangium longisporum TaxID=46187 RepID=A0ABN3Y5R0_9ACTN